MRRIGACGRPVLLSVAAFVAVVLSLPALAVNPPYLAEFPDPERVAKDFAQGKDQMDTLAHQVAALNRLYQLAAEMAGERRFAPGPDAFPNADELALRSRIGKLGGPLQREAEATFDPKAKGFDTPRAKWMRRLHNYQESEELLDELMQRYFSPQFQKSYSLITGYMHKVREQSAKETLRGSYTLRGMKMPRWEEMSADERRNGLIFGGAMVFLLILGLWLQLRRRPDVPADRNKLRTGFQGQTYDWATGTLSGFSARLEGHRWVNRPASVKTHWGDGTVTTSSGSGPETITHTTDVDEEFSLVYEGGQMDINLFHTQPGFESLATQYFKNSENHRVTAVWFRSKRDAEPRYLAFKDWTNGQDINPPIVRSTLRRSSAFLWTILSALGLGWVVGSSSDFVPFFEGRSRSFLMALTFGAVCFLVQLVIGMIDHRRVERQLQNILVTIGPDDAAPANPKAAPPNPR